MGRADPLPHQAGPQKAPQDGSILKGLPRHWQGEGTAVEASMGWRRGTLPPFLSVVGRGT